jgi:hypothetical protein
MEQWKGLLPVEPGEVRAVPAEELWLAAHWQHWTISAAHLRAGEAFTILPIACAKTLNRL